MQHRFDRSPGQRYRCEQYIPLLRQSGFDCVYSPLIVDEEEDRIFYGTGIIAKALLFIKAFFRRTKDVFRANEFDIIFIYREAFFAGSIFFERMLKRSGAKIVFDFDDAIWMPSTSAGNKRLEFLKRPDKVNDILALADVVIAGNKYLVAYAQKFNNRVEVIPSTIDMSYYSPPARPRNESVVIGWSGSHTTVEHFETLLPVLKRLKEKYSNKVSFRVYGDPHYKNTELDIVGKPWSPQTEVNEIAQFDIGIMPLPLTEWSKGKCGMKGLQYMALEVPAVMSDVGTNKEIIADGENGLLAYTDEEWFEKLSQLIESEELRKKLGAAGKKTVVTNYSLQSQAEAYLALFRNALA